LESKKTFEDIQEEYLEDVSWDEYNSSSKLANSAKYVVKYQNYYYSTVIKITKVQEEMNKKYQELYLYYKLDFDIQLKDNEIKNFIETNVEYSKLKSATEKLKSTANYFETCIKNVNSMRYDIKNFLEVEKFKAGIV